MRDPAGDFASGHLIIKIAQTGTLKPLNSRLSLSKFAGNGMTVRLPYQRSFNSSHRLIVGGWSKDARTTTSCLRWRIPPAAPYTSSICPVPKLQSTTDCDFYEGDKGSNDGSSKRSRTALPSLHDASRANRNRLKPEYPELTCRFTYAAIGVVGRKKLHRIVGKFNWVLYTLLGRFGYAFCKHFTHGAGITWSRKPAARFFNPVPRIIQSRCHHIN